MMLTKQELLSKQERFKEDREKSYRCGTLDICTLNMLLIKFPNSSKMYMDIKTALDLDDRIDHQHNKYFLLGEGYDIEIIEGDYPYITIVDKNDEIVSCYEIGRI